MPKFHYVDVYAKLKIFILFYVSLLSWCNVNAQETASVIVHGKSVQLQPSAAVFQTGYGNVTNYFSTYNGPTASLLINSGSNVISGELRPRSGSTDIFEGGYAQYTPVAAIDYGSYTVSIPTTDIDGNGIPDVIQYDKLGNYSATGSGNSAIVGPFSITFQFTRAAGSAVGTYVANTVNSLGGTNTINGVYNLVSYSGTVSYTRGISNTLSFNITNLASPSLTITGSTTFTTINSNQISYAAFTLTNNSGGVYHANAGTFNRSGNLYTGSLVLADGLLTTSWSDFTSYIIQITDNNDSNNNGTPDLSDSILPTIITQPVSQSVFVDNSVSFNISASATVPLNYQWQFNGVSIAGANSSSFTISNCQPSNAGIYSVLVSDTLGNVISNGAVLTVNTPAPPVITAQPQSQTVFVTDNAKFSLKATSNVALTYQWYFNGVAISGANNATLTLTNVSASQAGTYTVHVLNTGGSVTSDSVILYVNPVPVINSSNSATGYIGSIPFYYAITTEVPATSFGITQGILPPGLSLNTTTGLITGYPTTVGTYTVTLGAYLSTANVQFFTLGITINTQPFAFKTLATGLVNPQGVVVDSSGTSWVADTGNNTIDRITSSGTVTIFAGTPGVSGSTDGSGAVALFNAPTSITIDNMGNLFVVDSKNSTIRKITQSGLVSTFAGSSGIAGFKDGIGSAALFNHPTSIAIDSSNILYVADTGNGMIRQITPVGSVVNEYLNNSNGYSNLISPYSIAVIQYSSAASVGLVTYDIGLNKLIVIGFYSNGGGAFISNEQNITSVGFNIIGGIGAVANSNAVNFYYLSKWTSTSNILLINMPGLSSNTTQSLFSWNGNSVPNSTSFGSSPAFYISSSGNYYVTTSSSLLVSSPVTGPLINSQDTGGYIGQSISVNATGYPTPNYKWYLNGIALTTNSTSSSYNPLTSGTYTLAVSNGYGTIYSLPIVVTNPVPPAITVQPQSQVAYAGSNLTISAAASNASSYQWQFNGVAISGATNATLTLNNLTTAQAGTYSVVAFGNGTPAQSSNATLTVLPAISVPTFYSGLPNLIFIGSNSTTKTYSVTGLPNGLSYSPITGYISGTLQTVGTYNFTVSVNNGSTTNTLTVSLIVSIPPLALNAGPSIAANGLAIDSSNNYYFTSGNTVQKLINGTGNPIVIAGSQNAGGLDGAGTAAMFNTPTGIAIDASGNIYIADTGNSTIRKINPSGQVTTLAGLAGLIGNVDGSGLIARFNNPQGIAVDKFGIIYVADTGNNSIRKINYSGVVTTYVSESANINSPVSLTVNTTGTVYVVNSSSPNVTTSAILGDYASVVAIDTTGAISILAKNLCIEVSVSVNYSLGKFRTDYIMQGLSSGIAVDATGNVYVYFGSPSGAVGAYIYNYSLRGTVLYSAFNGAGLVKIDQTGKQTYTTITNSFNPNTAIGIDANGNVVIAGTLWSSTSPTKLAVLSYPTPPVITTQPSSVTLASGNSVLTNGYGKLTISANAGLDGLNYQWQYLGTNTAVGTNSVFNLNYNTIGTYVALVSTAFSAALSYPATVIAAPAITTQPISQTALAGSNATLSISAIGGDLSYQWYLNAKTISGATSSTYTINSLSPATSGAYYVVATNAAGSVTSTAAIVGLPNPGRIANLSVLSMDGPGNQLLTVGFVTGGAGTSGTQQLLIRGTGPALAAFNVPNVLPDPTISVYNSSTIVMASNDNWGTPSSNIAIINAADSATGAFALNPTTSNDAALVTNLTIGGYTVQVAGKNGASGNALAEVYDNTPIGTYNVGIPRLINISCLEQFAAGSYLTAGFIITGTTPETVLIRASGPTIAAAPFNIIGAISDPKLTVYDSNTNVIATNAGWAGNALISAAATKVGAFSFGSSSKDSAVLMTLNPGQYTVQAASATGAAGVTLIEVYEVPSN